MALSPYDQQVYDAGFKFIPQTQYLQNPFVIPQDDDTDTSGGITTLPVRDGGGGGNRSYETVTPDFTRYGVFADPKEYGPGGTYEVNPAALGFEFGPQGQVMRAGPTDYMQRQLGPTTTNPRMFGSSLDRAMFRVAGIPAGEIADMYDARMQNIPGQDFRNFLKNFTGAGSNFEVARAPGMIENLPGIAGFLARYGSRGDRSDTARFAVDDVGFGSTGQRDQFGVFTGGKTLLGKTGSYEERMKNEIADIAKNFGYSVDDLMGLDPATLEALGARNNFKKSQVIDYVNKIRAKDIESEYNEKQEALALEQKIKDQIAAGKSLSEIGQENFTGKGQAFEAGNTDQGGGFTGGTVKDTGGVPGGKYGSPRKDGGLMYADGGIVDMLEIYD